MGTRHGRGIARMTLVALGALVASLLTTEPAAAAGWSGPQELAANEFIAPAEIVTARDGSSTAVWSQDDTEGRERLYLRRIAPDGRMRPPVAISERFVPPVFYDVTVDDDGDAVVVWQVSADSTVQAQIMARRVSRTGERGPVVRVSDPDETSSAPLVAVTPSGVATIVYRRGQPTSDPNIVVRRLRRNSSLGGPTYLPEAHISAQPTSSRSGHVAFDLSPTVDGRALAVRVDPDGDVHTRQLGADLPGDEGVAATDLDRLGNVYAVVTSADRSRAWVRVWRVGGRLESARRVMPRGEEADWVHLRSDLSGDTMVLWADGRDTGSYSLRARWWHDGRLEPVSGLGRMDGPEVPPGLELTSWSIDLDDDGDGVLAWEVWSDALVDTFVRTRVIRRDGSFGRPRDLGTGGAPVVAVAPGGAARLTLWCDVPEVTQLLLWTRG